MPHPGFLVLAAGGGDPFALRRVGKGQAVRPAFTRTREITDALGSRLQVCVEAQPTGALVSLRRPDRRGRPCVRLDDYGSEVLWGYIMSARLALPGELPEERVEGAFPSRLSVAREPCVAIMMTQPELERPFELPATFWDRLYAELCLVNAHARAFAMRVRAGVA